MAEEAVRFYKAKDISGYQPEWTFSRMVDDAASQRKS